MEHNALKVDAELAGEFFIQKSESVSVEVKYFNTENASIFKITDLKEWFNENVRSNIQRQMEEFEEKDSGWSLRQILYLTININKFNPLKGSSYIPLPVSIRKKMACINVQNNDDECFKWAVLSAMHPQDKHPERVSHYKKYENELNFTGIDFPVSLKNVSKFERLNFISINVYILLKYGNVFKIQPCHVTSSKREKHVNLLLIQDYYVDEKGNEDEDDGEDVPIPKFHYVWIKNLSRLVGSQLTKNNRKHYICDRCLHFFVTEDNFQKHEIDCATMNKCKIQLPIRGNNILSFNNHIHKNTVPFVIYADFECLLRPADESDEPRVYQKHQAYSIGYYFKCSFDDTRSVYRSYRQEDENGQTPAEWFVQNLRMIAEELEVLYSSPQPMNLTREERQQFEVAKFCHICEKPFSAKDKRVKDHCHLTGRYRGAAHEGCNLNYKDARFIPIIFHNLTGYDSHFFVKEIATAPNFKGRVTLIAENKEKYISFTKYIEGSDINFRCIDSYRFLACSLQTLASYLVSQPITKTTFSLDGYTEPERIELLLKKGIFPYDYVDSFEKLQENQLPCKNDFFSKLNDSHISDEDYVHAQTVWDAFNIKTLGEYSDLYLKTDVLLLADVFENFRSTCLEAYTLDPCWYYTCAGLTWDAMLLYTEVELELLTDIDMLLFIEKGIRGGVSQCSNRYAKANNKFMENYNPEEEEVYLGYFDANNQYGWAMSQYLPQGNFKWVENVGIPDFFMVPDDCDIGFILEVDLEYPVDLHDAHKDLPLCPQHMIPPGSKEKKLLTTLYNKHRYVIHYRALKQAIEHGLILKKIHRALQFKQSAWLKPYVELNTLKRMQAKNEFEKLFFKLLINSVYGKTIENERKRVDVKLTNKWSGRYSAEALIAKPNFHSRSIFDENLVAIQLSRTEITIRKPIYVGLSVLDISKTLIYDFHYSFMKHRFGNRVQLLYTDTDSAIYKMVGINMYDVMRENIEKFDTSDYPENNQFDLPRVNKKVIGLMKDECCGKIMTEFIGLRSKMYSVRIQGAEPIKKVKGIKSSVVKNTIDFEDYRECLFNQSVLRRQQNNIRSRLHIVRTEKQDKVALSPNDDKRYLVPETPSTLPWGHYSILDKEDEELFDILMQLAEDQAAGEWGDEEMVGSQPIRKMDEGERVEVEVGSALQKQSNISIPHTQSTVVEEHGEPPKKKSRV